MGSEQAKRPTIGILAGMGPRSTAPFLNLVLTECEEQYGAKDDIDFPKLMICSLPVPFYPDRPTDHAAMETAIRDGLQGLARAGVDFLAIPCNTAHVYFQTLAASVDRPLLNMIELALEAIPAPPRTIAVIAARPTVESGIYQRGIVERGHQLVELDWQRDVDALIGATRGARSNDRIRSAWGDLVRKARERGADTLLVGCMDLSAVKDLLETDMNVVDAGHCLAREVVRRWRSWQPAEGDGRVDIERHRGPYRITTRQADMDTDAIHAYLTRSYWAEGISRAAVAKAISTSLCFGLFHEGRQVGFARVITDHVTYAYLCDVYVLEEHRKQNLGKWLVEVVTSYPTFQRVRRFTLATRDAHDLYARYGFTPLASPARYMELYRPDVYKK
jgi:aspartate racemase